MTSIAELTPLTEREFRTCSIDGCDRKHDSRGLCHMHRGRLERTGVVGGPDSTRGLTPTQRVLRRIVKDANGCWIWTGAQNNHGYGHLNIGLDRFGSTHRVVYEALRGPVPDGLVLDHLCRVSLCCNPDHLEVVTYRENSRRGVGANFEAWRQGTCRKGHLRSQSYYKRDGSLACCRPCRNDRRVA